MGAYWKRVPALSGGTQRRNIYLMTRRRKIVNCPPYGNSSIVLKLSGVASFTVHDSQYQTPSISKDSGTEAETKKHAAMYKYK